MAEDARWYPEPEAHNPGKEKKTCVGSKNTPLSRQIYAVPDLCCAVSRRSVESVEGVFDPVVSSGIAVLEHHLT